MPEATLPYWNDGKPFEPKVYPEDVAAYAQREGDLMRPVQEARAAWREAEALVQDLKEGRGKRVEVAKAQAAQDQAFAALQAADESAKVDILRVQADFVAETLKRCDPPLDKVLKLTVAEIRHGFAAIWTACHDWRRDAPEARPLGKGGGTSAPSPSLE